MKFLSAKAILLGWIAGFAACCVLGHVKTRTSIYRHFLRLNPWLEQESSYFSTASQLIATVHAQCPPAAGKVLVIIGGNSVFNGSAQKHDELWSRALQSELGDHYCVVNCSAPGAGVVDNGGVIFEALSREYPNSVFVTNTEPGRYPAADKSPYFYLFWDAYYKGLLVNDPAREARLDQDKLNADERDLKLGRHLNALLCFDDLWTDVSYRYFSTIWTASLKERSFGSRRRLPDWYDKRPRFTPSEDEFQKMLPDKIEALRGRPPLALNRFEQKPDGSWQQSAASLQQEKEQVSALLPHPLEQRSLIVFTPYNPWFVGHLTDAERSRLKISFDNGVNLLQGAGFHVLSLEDQGFEPADFRDTVHLMPPGGRRLAHLVAEAIRPMNSGANNITNR